MLSATTGNPTDRMAFTVPESIKSRLQAGLVLYSMVLYAILVTNSMPRVKVLLRCIDMTVLPYKEGFPKKDFMIKVNGVYISVSLV